MRIHKQDCIFDLEANTEVYIDIYVLPDAFMKILTKEVQKQFFKEPTIFVIHNAFEVEGLHCDWDPVGAGGLPLLQSGMDGQKNSSNLVHNKNNGVT